MHAYRVFLSYSHENSKEASAVLEHLRRIGVSSMSDHIIPGGARFSEEIRWQISCAHVFVSILTEQSQRSTWVVSELGYALGLGVPILPLSLGELPEGLAQELHAVKIKADVSNLADTLTYGVIEDLVLQARDEGRAAYECADNLRQRTDRLVREARRIQRFSRAGALRVRQRMAFSSFSIPDAPARSHLFDERNGVNRRSDEERDLLRNERQVMEENARKAGCDLILDPYVSLEEPDQATQGKLRFKHAPAMTRVRLEILRDFLQKFPGNDIRIAFNPGQISGSVIILGDWLVAEAVVPHYKTGYRQTIITRHAPTVLARIDSFDQELQDCLKTAGVSPEDSRRVALAEIEKLIEKTRPDIG